MKLTFIRFGGLSSVNQKGYKSSMPSFHSPPMRRGIYAMVVGSIEMFLVGGNFNPNNSKKKKDKKGNVLYTNPGEGKIFEDGKWITLKEKYPPKPLRELKPPKKFEYDGEIWSHLNIPRNEIIKEKGSWKLSTMEAFKKAYKKELGVVKRQRYSKDHLEVFIEKV